MSEEQKDWKDSLPEDLKGASELKNFKSPEDGLRSYVQLSKKFHEGRESIKEGDSFDEFSAKTKSFFNMPDDVKKFTSSYEGEDKKQIEEIAFKHNIHPNQIKGFVSDLKNLNKEQTNLEKNLQIEKWRESTKEILNPIKNKDEVLGRAFAKLGLTRENFEDELKGVANNPLINKMLLELGKETETSAKPPLTTGSGSSADELTIQEKLNYVNGHLTNHSGPFYNPKSDAYSVTRAKVERYKQDLINHQMQTGQEITIPLGD